MVLVGLFLRPWGARGLKAIVHTAHLRVVEQVGCLMIATSCATYCAVIGARLNISNSFITGAVAAIGLGFVLRCLRLRQIDTQTLDQLRQANNAAAGQ